MVTTDQSDTWRAFCSGMFAAAIRPVLPENCLPKHLPDPTDYSAVKLIALGKGAAAMARVVEESWPDVNLSGIAVCRDGYGQPCNRIEVIESAHPVPDERSLKAAERALDIARSTLEGVLLLVLLSGGGSALACLPADGVSLKEKQQLVRALMHAGADIRELNTVRKQLSRIKGGRLAAAAARAGHIFTLAISDVVGDDPSLIASGPTVSDSTTRTDAIAVLDKYGISHPSRWAGWCGPVPGDRTSFQIVASGAHMLTAAQAYAEKAGFSVQFLGDDIVGEARDVARNHASMVTERLKEVSDKPVLLLSGGELTSTVTGTGKGGPNQEYVLALATALQTDAGVYAFAADTDGMDGVGGAAGAFMTPEDRKRAATAGTAPTAMLKNNNSHQYFKDLDCLFKVKPTGTNVNDLRVIAVAPKGLPQD